MTKRCNKQENAKCLIAFFMKIVTFFWGGRSIGDPLLSEYPERGFSKVPEFSPECREKILLPGHDPGQNDGLIRVSKSP